ncbi:unnamed protein product [Ilex paraguariensis]|uniref:F-box domain-containing protein n=1 Tax=Ilex paraguariensis TaxID=185542 RepID=A0ABC8R8Y6_9AQUA
MAQDSKPQPFIPHEIVVKILSRLPVKSLLQLRCVSKLWRSLISSPQFAKTHLDVSSKNKDYAKHRLIFISACYRYCLKTCSLQSMLYEPSVTAIDVECPISEYSLVGCCNGLVCIAVNYESIFLWNPSTRESKKLTDYGVTLKNIDSIALGFGYDESSDDYKVVGIFVDWCNWDSYENEVQVYSLRTDTWKRIEQFPGGTSVDFRGKLASGALHWAWGSDMQSTDWVIVSLDLAKEMSRTIAQPNYVNDEFSSMLGVLGECLCILRQYGNFAELWVMKEYGKSDSWSKIATMSYSMFPKLRNQYDTPICISEDGKLLLSMRREVGLYNPKDNTVEYPEVHNSGACFEHMTYVESLVSPNVDKGAERQQQ